MKTTTVVLFVIKLFLLFDKTESINQLNQPQYSSQRLCNFYYNFNQILSTATLQPQGKLIPPIPCSLEKLHLSVSQSLASEELFISGISRLYDELCSQLCEIIVASNGEPTTLNDNLWSIYGNLCKVIQRPVQFLL